MQKHDDSLAAMKEGNVQDASCLAMVSRQTVKLFDLCYYYSFVAPLQVALAQWNVQNSISLLKSLLEDAFMPSDIKKSKANREDFG